MKTIAQFTVHEDNGIYIAEGVDLAVVTQADNLDALVKNIEEAVSLHFEGEDAETFAFTKKPSILVNYEIPQYA